MIAYRLEVDEAISIHIMETALLAGSCEYKRTTRIMQGVLRRRQLLHCCLRQVRCFLQV